MGSEKTLFKMTAVSRAFTSTVPSSGLPRSPVGGWREGSSPDHPKRVKSILDLGTYYPQKMAANAAPGISEPPIEPSKGIIINIEIGFVSQNCIHFGISAS
jgi:hypothetical protein